MVSMPCQRPKDTQLMGIHAMPEVKTLKLG